MADIFEGLIIVVMAIFALFIGIFLIIALAPSIGQVGGGLYEVLFILLGLFMVVATVAAYVLGRR